MILEVCLDHSFVLVEESAEAFRVLQHDRNPISLRRSRFEIIEVEIVGVLESISVFQQLESFVSVGVRSLDEHVVVLVLLLVGEHFDVVVVNFQADVVVHLV